MEKEWRMSHWLLSNVGKKVGRAGIQIHNPWIDSLHRYLLSYRGSPFATMFSTFSQSLSIQLQRFSICWQTMFKVVSCRIVVWGKGLINITGKYKVNMTLLFTDKTNTAFKYNQFDFKSLPHIDAFWCLCSRQLLKKLWQKEKLLIISNFSFCHKAF